jgi:hypothetical protein
MTTPKERWNVLQINVLWLDLSNDANGVRPEVAFVVAGKLLSRRAKRLAREARSDDIHRSSPGTPVECSGVVPDRRVVEVSVRDSLLEDGDAVGVDFDVAGCSPSEQPSGGE